MSRDDAVRAAAKAIGAPADMAYAAVEAAEPHLTADLVRERDKALAEVERLRTTEVDSIAVLSVAMPDATVPWLADIGVAAAISLLMAQRDEALAAIARVEALCERADDEARRLDFIDGEGGLTTSEVRAALRGDQ